MSLKEAIANTQPRARGSICTVRLILEQLDDTDTGLLNGLLTDTVPTVRVDVPQRWQRSHSEVADILTAAGFAINQQTVARHRNGGCHCDAR